MFELKNYWYALVGKEKNMDQEKIGKFIAECRKEKSITQKELAEKLGVTDKTVSRWENGHYLPDISLFNDICSILDIQVSELLGGEKMKDKIDKDEINNTITNLVNISNEKIKYKSKKVIMISSIIIVALTLVFGIVLYFNNSKNKHSYHLPNSDVTFPTRYAQIEKEDGWVCSFTMEYLYSDLKTPYYYGYNCDNLKYSRLNDYIMYGEEADANGKFTYEIETDHPSYLRNKELNDDIKKISNYFLEKKFTTIINLTDLEELYLKKIDKKEVLDLYNSAISSKLIKKFGNYPNTNRTIYLTNSINKDNYTWKLGYVLVMGHIKYVNIELLIDEQYLSDLIKENQASAEQKEIFNNIKKIENYIIKNQKFDIPNELKNVRPYSFLVENTSEINDYELGIGD